jgi:hypothetical protein
MTVADYAVQALVGLGAAAIGAAAVLWNGNRQRKVDHAVELQRIEESRKGARREIEARLRELAEHIAAFRVNGFGEPSATQETYNRLKELMASESGAASLPSDELARQIYSMLQIARLNLQTLNDFSDRDSRRQIAPQDFHDFLEQSQIQYSNIIDSTRKALIEVFETLDDERIVSMLRGTEEPFNVRMKAYAARVDAQKAQAATLLSPQSRDGDL